MCSPRNESCASFRWDSRQFAVTNMADPSVRVHDTTTGKEVRRLPLDVPYVLLAFRPGSSDLAVGGGKVVRVFDLDAGNVPLRALSHPEYIYSIAWHPDGRTLATTCNDLRIRLWDVSTGMLALPPLDGHHVDGMSVEFNHTGDRLASTDWGGTMRLWDGRTGRQLLSATGSATVFSADDRRLGVEITGSRTRLLRVAGGRELQSLVAANPSRGRRVYRHAWYSPDGRFLMVDAIDGLVFLDSASGVQIDKIPFAGTTVVAFEPGNTAVLTWDRSRVLRWPIREDPTTATIHVGPSGIIDRVDYTEPDPAAGSPDGSVLVFPNRNRGAILLRRPGRAWCWGLGRTFGSVRSAPTADGLPPAITRDTKVWGPRSGTPKTAKWSRTSPSRVSVPSASVPMAAGWSPAAASIGCGEQGRGKKARASLSRIRLALLPSHPTARCSPWSNNREMYCSLTQRPAARFLG